MRALLKEARPKQWVKNVLVFAAPAAAGELTHGDVLLTTILAFVAFCMASAGTYYWNDIHDVEADRTFISYDLDRVKCEMCDTKRLCTICGEVMRDADHRAICKGKK